MLGRRTRGDSSSLLRSTTNTEHGTRHDLVGDLDLSDESGSLRGQTRLGLYLVDLHVVDELTRQFSERFGSELHRIVVTVEGNELDNIALGHFSTRSQEVIITIQNVHLRKIGITNSNDDDRHGKGGGINNRINRLIHISDLSIGDDEQKQVSRDVVLSSVVALSDACSLTDGRRKVRRTVKTDPGETVAIGSHDTFNSFNLRSNGITSESEAVRSGAVGQLSSKSIQSNISISIVGKQDITNIEDSLSILVETASRIEIVKRVGGSRVTIRGGIIDRNHEVQLASTS